jgi:hypothetical protein
VQKNNSGISAGSDYGNDPDDWSNLPHDPSEDGVNYPDVAESTTREGGISKPTDTNDNNPAVTDDPGDDEENTTKTTKKPRKKTTKKPTKKKKKRPIYRQPPIRPEVVPVPVPQLPEPRRPRITGPGMPAGKNNEPNKKDRIPCGRSRCCSGADYVDFCTCHYCQRDKDCCNPQLRTSE